MRYKIVAIAPLFIASVLGFQLPVFAQTQALQHDHDAQLKSGQVKPRIGVISEVVARQKLVTYGVENVRELKLVGDKYVIKATYNNRPVELEMNVQSGLLKEKGSLVRLPVATSVRSRVINNRHIKVERQELVDPARIKPSKQPNR